MKNKSALDGDTKKVLESISKTVDMPDLLDVSHTVIGGWGAYVLSFDGMINQELLSDSLRGVEAKGLDRRFKSGLELYNFLNDECFINGEKKIIDNLEDCYDAIVNGFSVILIECFTKAIKLGTQGFPTRAVSEPTANNFIKGSKEAFTESIKMNEAMVRRRIKSPSLRMKEVFIGKESRTRCSVVYMNGRASVRVVAEVEKIFCQNDVEMVLETGVFEILIHGKQQLLYSHVNSTDRPDVLCKRLFEGRVGILVDGVPFAVVVPFLFGDNFQTLDDYDYKTTFVNLLRAVRYLAFIIAIFAPAVYIAFNCFAPDLLSPLILRVFLAAQANNPFTVMVEVLIVTMLYEVMREAGLRLPKEVGHTISIVGSIIIGETAVHGNFLSPPVVLIAAIVSIATYLVPTLVDTVVVLRIVSIFAAGYFGFYGIGAVLAISLVLLFTKKNLGVRYVSSVLPFFKSYRQSFASSDITPLSRR